MEAFKVLLLPGWQNSGADHWQSRWEILYGYQRVEQHDWMRPLRGDWMMRLEEEILKQEAPVCLAAHSLGCILVAWWAAHSRLTSRVRGALLVAPPDIEREDNRQAIPGWAPVQRQHLPFGGVLVASSDDPYGSLENAGRLATEWGVSFYQMGAKGHINADSGLGDWEEGHRLLSHVGESRWRSSE